MATHICRDLFERALSPDTSGIYWIAIFLRHVLGFTVIGQTNFNLNGSTITKGSGSGASINLGSTNEFAVAIPSGQYVVSISDVDRILALRSSSNPGKNSGLFRITGIDTASNRVFINYATGDYPPAEVASLSWAICEIETLFIANNTGNAVSGGYRSNGSAACSRIILQSPHSSGWQVRLCRESSTDSGNGIPNATIAPGFGGDSAGDFPVGGEHLHHNLWRNQSNSTYTNAVVGLDRFNGLNDTGAGRIYMWGDDSTGSVVYVNRHAGSLTNHWVIFGLAENEETPLPPIAAQRLFVIGKYRPTSPGGFTETSSVYFTSDFDNAEGIGGAGFGLSRSPISACMSSYAKLAGQQTAAGTVKFDTGASDNMFTLQTELQTVDVIVGTYDNYDSSGGDSVIQLEVRRLGTLPHARSGRSNIGRWSLSVDRMWFHLMNGIWLPWSGLGNQP
jgi:hypothetical protein